MGIYHKQVLNITVDRSQHSAVSLGVSSDIQNVVRTWQKRCVHHESNLSIIRMTFLKFCKFEANETIWIDP